MKFAGKLHLVLMLVTLGISVAVALGGQQTVYAAGCITEPTTDGQIKNQSECRQKYLKDCKKNFKKAFCENLSIKEINSCAQDSGYKLKKACLQKIADKEKDTDKNDDTSNIGNDYDRDDCSTDSENLSRDNCGLVNMIVIITNAISALAATVIVAMIIWGGIEYSMAGGDASKVQAAKSRITNALLALLLLIFGFSIIQWLVPGGLI